MVVSTRYKNIQVENEEKSMSEYKKIKLSKEELEKVAGGWHYGQACPFCTAGKNNMLSIGVVDGEEYFECQECHARLRNPKNY